MTRGAPPIAERQVLGENAYTAFRISYIAGAARFVLCRVSIFTPPSNGRHVENVALLWQTAFLKTTTVDICHIDRS